MSSSNNRHSFAASSMSQQLGTSLQQTRLILNDDETDDDDNDGTTINNRIVFPDNINSGYSGTEDEHQVQQQEEEEVASNVELLVSYDEFITASSSNDSSDNVEGTNDRNNNSNGLIPAMERRTRRIRHPPEDLTNNSAVIDGNNNNNNNNNNINDNVLNNLDNEEEVQHPFLAVSPASTSAISTGSPTAYQNGGASFSAAPSNTSTATSVVSLQQRPLQRAGSSNTRSSSYSASSVTTSSSSTVSDNNNIGYRVTAATTATTNNNRNNNSNSNNTATDTSVAVAASASAVVTTATTTTASTVPTRSVTPSSRAVAAPPPQATSQSSSSYQQQQLQRSLVIDLQSHLNDEEISDIQLKGTDDRCAYAVRSILAMRSKFFRTLLYGKFKERNLSIIPLGYTSLVLKAVIEYCYTDDIKVTFENLTFEETARAMVGLVSAGNYFDLQGLMQRAYRLTCLMMDEYPALACAVLDESLSSNNLEIPAVENEIIGPNSDDDSDDGDSSDRDDSHLINNNYFCHAELSRVALGIIRLRTESSLLPPNQYGLGVQSLGPLAMERIMMDDKIQADELSLFICLKKWAEHVAADNSNSDNGNNGNGVNDNSDEQLAAREERKKIAQQLASRIEYSKISPSDLCTEVASSGLVSTELLCNAYKEQALQAERQGMLFAQLRTSSATSTSPFGITSNHGNNNADGKCMVQGAGLSAVNGTYESSSSTTSATNTHCAINTPSLSSYDYHHSSIAGAYHQHSSNGIPRYVRHGKLPGCGDGLFFLHTCKLQDDSKKWFLSFRSDKYYWDLYSAPLFFESEHDPPPMQKWLAVIPSHTQLRQIWKNTANIDGKSSNRSSKTGTAGATSFTGACYYDNGSGSNASNYGEGDESNLPGDPPPICIWLPDEPTTT